MLKPGTRAPSFTATDASGRAWDLAALHGRPFVLTFYPKDETAGCVAQVCAFRDVWSDLEPTGVRVFGVSRDDAASHEAFQKARKLPYELLTDASGAMHKAFDVGRSFGVTNRVSYLVAADAVIVDAYEANLAPARHAQRMLDAARSLAR